MPGGATALMELGALDDVEPDLLPPLRPDHRRRPGRAPRGPDHRCRRPARGPADRQRRPHQPPAPHRGPHLRARQARHRAAGGALAPARPARRRQRRLGHGPRPARAANVIPAAGVVGGTVRMLDAVAWSHGAAGPRLHRRDRGAVRREGRGRLPPRRPAGGQRRRPRRRCSAGAVERVLGAGGRVRHDAEPGRRGLRLVPHARPRRHGSARHPRPRAGRRTTSTRATCASTRAPRWSPRGSWRPSRSTPSPSPDTDSSADPAACSLGDADESLQAR